MSKRWGLAALAATALLLVSGSPALADPRVPRVTQIDQVSNQPGHAKLTDANAVNSWGLALSPTSPL